MMRWRLCMLWVSSMGWRVLATVSGSEFDTSWWSCALPQLLPLGVLVHVSIGDAQPLTAEGWRFLPPWSPGSVKSLAGSTSPVGSGLVPGKFLFLMWNVSSQTLKWIVWVFFAILLYYLGINLIFLLSMVCQGHQSWDGFSIPWRCRERQVFWILSFYFGDWCLLGLTAFLEFDFWRRYRVSFSDSFVLTWMVAVGEIQC